MHSDVKEGARRSSDTYECLLPTVIQGESCSIQGQFLANRSESLFKRTAARILRKDFQSILPFN